MAGEFMYAGRIFKVETIDLESVKVSYENYSLIVKTANNDIEKSGNYHVYDLDDEVFRLSSADTPSEAIVITCNLILKDIERRSGFKSYEESCEDLIEWVNKNTN